MNGIALFHYRDLKICECQCAVCRFKGWISGIDACPGRILDDGDPFRYSRLPADSINGIPLQIGKQQYRIVFSESERRMDALFCLAAQTGKIDRGIAACRNRAGGDLPFEWICLVVRQAIVFQSDGTIAAVVELHPAISGCVIRWHNLADGERAEVLGGKHSVQRTEDFSRIFRSWGWYAGITVGAIGFAGVGNIRIQRRNIHLRHKPEVGIRYKNIVSTFAQAKVGDKRICRHVLGSAHRIKNQIFARAESGSLGQNEFVQILHIIRNTIAGEIHFGISGVIELDPVRCS